LTGLRPVFVKKASESDSSFFAFSALALCFHPIRLLFHSVLEYLLTLALNSLAGTGKSRMVHGEFVKMDTEGR